MIDIRTEKQLFIDDCIIDGQERIARTLHQFKRHPANPLLVPEMPWERANFVYGAVIRDPEIGLFRLWCTNSGARPDTEEDYEFRVQVCYAESKDGLAWDRPDLGIVEIDRSSQNNVVASNAGGGCLRAGSVVYSPDTEDPALRYVHLNQMAEGTAPSYSADGLHWTADDPPIFMASDAATLSYDQRQDRFFCSSVTDVEARGFVRRSISMTDTDLQTWREFETVLVADEIDDAGVAARVDRIRPIIDYDNPEHYHAELHHMVAFPYESLTLGIVTLWDNTWYSLAEPLHAGGRDRAVIHLQLTVSRDPDWKNWRRMDRRLPLIEPSDPGDWDCATRMPLHAPVVVGDELWLYYSGFAGIFNGPRMYGAHMPVGEKVPANGIGLATMRLDGFASLDAGPRGGAFTTKPFTFEGNRLTLNARALGHITADLLDAEGNPLEGFDPASVAGDSVRHTVTWDNLKSLVGRPVRLRFRMWNAALYAFAFEE